MCEIKFHKFILLKIKIIRIIIIELGNLLFADQQPVFNLV